MKSKKTQYMTSMALFLAIEIILVVTPLGYIPIGPLNATTMHIPVIIAGTVLGKKAGAELGFVFGLTSLIKATIQPGITSFCFSPFVTIGTMSGNYKSLLIAFVPRILLGYLAGFVFEIMKKISVVSPQPLFRFVRHKNGKFQVVLQFPAAYILLRYRVRNAFLK